MDFPSACPEHIASPQGKPQPRQNAVKQKCLPWRRRARRWPACQRISKCPGAWVRTARKRWSALPGAVPYLPDGLQEPRNVARAPLPGGCVSFFRMECPRPPDLPNQPFCYAAILTGPGYGSQQKGLYWRSARWRCSASDRSGPRNCPGRAECAATSRRAC